MKEIIVWGSTNWEILFRQQEMFLDSLRNTFASGRFYRKVTKVNYD